MRSPSCFIVRPVNDKRYDDTRTIGDVEFIVSVSEEDHRFSNRQAEVIELPLSYSGDISIGDTLLVHHNVFKFYNDIKGKRRSGKSFLKDNLFLIDDEQFFMYKHNGEWHTHDRYCFVKPIPPEQSYIKKFITYEPLMGIMMYPTPMLIEQGVKKGDTICFRPGNEYVFNVDGETLYRIFDHQIVMTL